MSSNIYDILNKFQSLDSKPEPKVEQQPKAKTRLQESIDTVSEKYMGFKKVAAAAGKKLGEEQGVAEGLSDIVKGVKRKVAGKEKPEDVVQRRYIDTVDANHAGKDVSKTTKRYNKVHSVVNKEGVAEAGPFSYGKPPRKGSVADLAAKKRKEQERGQQPIEPKDQQVGVARVTKGVAAGSEQEYKIYFTFPGYSDEEATIVIANSPKEAAQKFKSETPEADIKDIIPLGPDGFGQQGVAEGSSTTWEVSYDYGPHMTKTVTVKAGSEEEARA